MNFVPFALAALTLNADPTPPTPIPADAPHVRQVVERSLAYLAKNKANYGCVSCHDGAWLIWSAHEAENRGFSVNRKALDLIQTRAVKGYSGHAELKPAGMDGFRDLSTNMLYLTPALLAAKNVDPETTALLDRFTAQLLKKQKAEGNWVINHMGRRDKSAQYGKLIDDNGDEYQPPLIDKRDITTMWAFLALTSREQTGPVKDEVAKSRDKALKWLKENPSTDSLQAAMLHVLLAKRFGTAEELQTAVKELRDRQNADGGWSQVKDIPSDGVGTGQALVALTSAGFTAKDPAIEKAWSFLVHNQTPEGCWPGLNSRYFPKDHKEKLKDFDAPKFMGAAWAVIGLVRSLPADPNEAAARDNQPRLSLKERIAQKPKELDLYGSETTDGDLKELAGLIDLQTLDLSRTKITDAGLAQLAGFSQLKSLDLSYNTLTDAGVKELINLPNLQSLNLSYNVNVTDAALKELAAHLPQLQTLNLEGTSLTVAALKELENFKQLKVVITAQSKLKDGKAVTEFRKKWPKLFIAWDLEDLEGR